MEVVKPFPLPPVPVMSISVALSIKELMANAVVNGFPNKRKPRLPPGINNCIESVDELVNVPPTVPTLPWPVALDTMVNNPPVFNVVLDGMLTNPFSDIRVAVPNVTLLLPVNNKFFKALLVPGVVWDVLNVLLLLP